MNEVGWREGMSSLEKINDFLNKILPFLRQCSRSPSYVRLHSQCIFKNPFIKSTWRGAYETVGFLGAIVIAFALGYTQKRKDHIVVDILTQRFSKQVNRVLDAINYLLRPYSSPLFPGRYSSGDEDI